MCIRMCRKRGAQSSDAVTSASAGGSAAPSAGRCSTVSSGPFTAFVQADIIQHHALSASEGKTYAELEQDDPVRATMMNASFLRASLFTSVVSFGVATMAMGIGLAFILGGVGLRAVPAAAGDRDRRRLDA